MAKDILCRVCPVALVVMGWLSFAAGQLLELAPLHRFILLGAARVLPQALEHSGGVRPYHALSIPGACARPRPAA